MLLRNAAHIIRPLNFILPHTPALRPAWLIRLGLYLYDNLGGLRLLPPSKAVRLSGAPLKSEYKKGFVYSDCWVQDARLVVVNAMDAARRGATICTRTECISAVREGPLWNVQLRDARTGNIQQIEARALVNAAGPWAAALLDRVKAPTSHKLRLAKGSHIVVKKLFSHDNAYIFQQPDGRIVFAIPFERDFTLIGTTDIDYTGDPADAKISDAEIAYLCDAVNRYFAKPVAPADVVWTYAGVRPLLDDASANISTVTRDYALEWHAESGLAPVLHVYGGKLTTYRVLAEEAVDKIAPSLGRLKRGWTEDAMLPGGEIPKADFDNFLAAVEASYPWLGQELALHYARTYGTCLKELVKGCNAIADLGTHFGGDFYEAEARYLITHEWVETAEDILWRRTKHGLHVGEAGTGLLRKWLAEKAG